MPRRYFLQDWNIRFSGASVLVTTLLAQTVPLMILIGGPLDEVHL